MLKLNESVINTAAYITEARVRGHQLPPHIDNFHKLSENCLTIRLVFVLSW